ncbi:hypothetical protein Cgig2_021328 [Carnegiea gigantea]|uniref:Uncharacterized protein n=1 Tax=Carnegiea gigantea TaxID=171969 RepID=A0A9Q1Q4E7_9CARY|nr:hypothetical protein Cgig2_021328 [Carnegiea gigantea]
MDIDERLYELQETPDRLDYILVQYTDALDGIAHNQATLHNRLTDMQSSLTQHPSTLNQKARQQSGMGIIQENLLMVACYYVVCFLWWFKGNFVWPCGVGCYLPILLYIVGLMGCTFSHLSLALIVFAPFFMLMSANSSTESLSPSKSKNGDIDNLH